MSRRRGRLLDGTRARTMDELLGIDEDDLIGGLGADSSSEDDEVVAASSPPKTAVPLKHAGRHVIEDDCRLLQSGGIRGLSADAFTADDQGQQPAEAAVSIAVTPNGLGIFAARDFAAGETIFSERPQVVTASNRTNVLKGLPHCGWCLRGMMPCPPELPHPEYWPQTPRQTACGRCGEIYCCRSCHDSAQARGHHRLCGDDGGRRLATFEACCREQMALSSNPGQLVASARLVLRMMAHILAHASPNAPAEGVPPASAVPPQLRERARQLYEHLTTTTYTPTAARDWCASAATRLYPLAQRTLGMSEEESAWLDEPLMADLLRAVRLNALWIEPVSAFSDYVRASRSLRRADGGQMLRALEAHAEALRQGAAARQLQGASMAAAANAAPGDATEASAQATEQPGCEEEAQADLELAACRSVDEVCTVIYGIRGGGLYRLQSKMNHACEPAAKVVCAFTDSTIDVVATRNITRGEELTLSYVDPSVGDQARRRRTLRDCYGFDCRCATCRKLTSAEDT